MPSFSLRLIALSFLLLAAQHDRAQQASPPPPAAPQNTPYDPAIFQKPVPADQLTFIKQFEGKPTRDLWRDKQFHKIVEKDFVPDTVFRYGRDMPLFQALDMLLSESHVPVRLLDSRYVLITGGPGPYLDGKAFLWIDLQQGVGAGGFYFHPTNGEPTPTVAGFSQQIREKALGLSDLPPEYAVAMAQWSDEMHIAPLTTRYFITGSHRRDLLEHDEDFCAPLPGMPPFAPGVCDQMNADAADLDVNTAYYLKQVDYRTNATAYMIVGADQNAFIRLQNSSCIGALALSCRRNLAIIQVHRVTGRPGGPGVHPGHR